MSNLSKNGITAHGDRCLRRNGQISVEYAVMFVVFVLVVIAASIAVMKPAYNRFYNGVGNIMDNAVGDMYLDTSVVGGSGGSGTGGDTGGTGGDTGGDTGGGTGGDTGGDTGGGTGGDTGGDTGGGTGDTEERPPVIDSASLDQALEALKTYDTGLEYYNLIEAKDISLIYEDLGDDGWLGYWYAPDNKIAINSSLSESPSSVLASIIAHESTHADYTYNPQKWVNTTLERHPELVLEELHITTYPYYSLDQEYMAFYETSTAWENLKGVDTNPYMETVASLISAGEDFTKAYLRSIPDYADLPDY